MFITLNVIYSEHQLFYWIYSKRDFYFGYCKTDRFFNLISFVIVQRKPDEITQTGRFNIVYYIINW